MIKIFFCLVVIGLFISCSGGGVDLGPVEDKGGQNFTITPSGKIVEGFRKHTNHLYGFDSGGGIVHISLPRDQTGYVEVITDKVQAEDHDYYYCNPDSWEQLLNLDHIPANEKQEHRLEITPSTPQRIALCREKFDKMIISRVQELQIHRYEWKNYDFYVYTFGNSPVPQYEFLDRDRITFWREFNSTYNQAIVGYSQVVTNRSRPVYLFNAKRSYILSRARGNYDDVKCTEGDIVEAINDMEENASPSKNAVIQVDSPVKRFWPLKKSNHYLDKIEICGNPDLDQDPTRLQNTTLVLELLPNTPPNLDCPSWIMHGTTVRWYALENAWYLVYNNGEVELATIDNAHPECAVFAEKNTRALGQEQYIGEISKGRGAEATRKPNKKVTTVILPWQGDLNATKTVAFHELGHTMGLDDINLSTNLMHHANKGTNRLLQKRVVNSYINGRQEYQWECLQEINFNINCASPNFIYRGP
jgi:hypothetical protein